MESKSSGSSVHRGGFKHSSDDEYDYDSQEKTTYALSEAKEAVLSRMTNTDRSRTLSESKAKDLEDEEDDLRTDEEFETLKISGTVVVPLVAATQAAKNFANGFRMSVYSMVCWCALV